MNQPEAYSLNSQFQRAHNAHVLQKYLPLMELNENGANILDIGCGPGDTTVQTLMPLMPASFNKLIGCDVCEEMVVHCKKRYGNDRIDFVVFDVEAASIPRELENQFDHVFSFWCLHWIDNQRLSFSNINRLLKRGGNMLLSYISSYPYYESVRNLHSTEKWRKHMGSFDKHITPLLHRPSGKGYFEKILLDAGFNITLLKETPYSYAYRSFDHIASTHKFADPFLVDMDEDLHDEYMQDLVQEMVKCSGSIDNSGRIVLEFKMFEVVAGKK